MNVNSRKRVREQEETNHIAPKLEDKVVNLNLNSNQIDQRSDNLKPKHKAVDSESSWHDDGIPTSTIKNIGKEEIESNGSKFDSWNPQITANISTPPNSISHNNYNTSQSVLTKMNSLKIQSTISNSDNVSSVGKRKREEDETPQSNKKQT